MKDNRKNNVLGIELTILAAGMRIRVGLLDGAVSVEPEKADGLPGGCPVC
jgi:hypothetical protein